MTDDELLELIEEIRDGRSEESWLDWKRQWWGMNADGKREFLKDICGMANATVAGGGPRHIIIGVNSKGQVHDSPLPVDEAELQQLLLSITPVPAVTFGRHTIQGVNVVVATLHPPYDQPYVAKVADQYVVWVRMGSRVGTASRGQLDRLYSARFSEARAPKVFLTWKVDGLPGKRRGETPAGLASDEYGESVQVPASAGNTYEEVIVFLEAEVERLRKQAAAHTGNPAVEAAVGKFVEGRDRFVRHIADRGEFERWSLSKVPKDHRRCVRFCLHNEGDAEAHAIRAVVELPEWLLAFEERDEPRYVGPDMPDPPDIEDLVEPESDAERHARMRLLGLSLNDLLGPSGAIPGLSSVIGRPAAIDLGSALSRLDEATLRQFGGVHVEGSSLVLDRDRLLHAHEKEFRERLVLVALPEAPVGVHPLRVQVFHRELRGYEDRVLMVEVVPNA